jgi:hypothetical protein
VRISYDMQGKTAGNKHISMGNTLDCFLYLLNSFCIMQSHFVPKLTPCKHDLDDSGRMCMPFCCFVEGRVRRRRRRWRRRRRRES